MLKIGGTRNRQNPSEISGQVANMATSLEISDALEYPGK